MGGDDPTSQPPMRRAEIALAVGSTVLSLLALLGFDYLYSRQNPTDPFAVPALKTNGRSLYTSKPNGWYELNANYSGQDRYGRLVYNVRTDQHGFRIPTAREAAALSQAGRPSPAGGKPALVFIGDSFTYGLPNNWQDTFVGMTAARYPGRVINAGVLSHSPTPHLYRLRRMLNDGSIPDGAVVIMALDIGDVQDEASRWVATAAEPMERNTAMAAQVVQRRLARRETAPRTDSRQRDSTGSGATPRQEPWFRPQTFQLTHQIYFGLEGLYKRFFDHWQVRNQTRSAITHRPWAELDAKYQPLGIEAALHQIRARIEEAARVSQAHGHPFWLLIYPWPAQLAYADTFSWEDFVRQSCRKPACSGVINTFPAFRADVGGDRASARWQERLYVKGDMHFNREGNAIVARTILQALD